MDIHVALHIFHDGSIKTNVNGFCWLTYYVFVPLRKLIAATMVKVISFSLFIFQF